VEFNVFAFEQRIVRRVRGGESLREAGVLRNHGVGV